MPGKIFISYRRDDSRADARSIYQRLERTFGAQQLFMDVDTIQKGRDFTRVLDDYLATSNVMLPIIGREWLTSADEEGRRRLDDPDDFVRLEIAAALKRDIAIIPVLVDGARMPKAAELPDDLKPLAKRQASIVTHENFARDLEGLERDLERIMGKKKSYRRAIAFTAAGLVLTLGAFLLFGFPEVTLGPSPVEMAAGEKERDRVADAFAQEERKRQEAATAETERKAAEERDRRRLEEQRKTEAEIERQRAAALKAQEESDRLAALDTAGKTGAPPDRGWLGVKIQNLDDGAAKSLSFSGTKGVVISSIVPGAPGDNAGLKAQDIVISVNGQAVADSRAFAGKVAEYRSGTTVTLKIWRGESTKTLKAKLGTFPQQPAAAPANDALALAAPTPDVTVDAETNRVLPGLTLAQPTDGSQGVTISSVDSGSEAENKGLRQGDRIFDIGNRPIKGLNTISEAIAEATRSGRQAILLRVQSADNKIRIFALPIRADGNRGKPTN